jgi:N-acetylneuraminic acid mutarotase
MQRVSLAIVSIIVIGALVAPQPARTASVFFASDALGGSWALTSPLKTARIAPMAVTLSNGKVLVAGGIDNQNHDLASVELFDPQTGSWTPAAALPFQVSGATMTLLANGTVLVAGGDTNRGVTTAAEIYDPAKGRWTRTGPLGTPRKNHTATLLQNGQVLVCGGTPNGSDSLASAEIYNPATGKWLGTGGMSVPRQDHAAALLNDGRVLLTGGSVAFLQGTDGSSEIFDPSTRKFALVGRMMSSRFFQTETTLADGSVIVAGGAYGDLNGYDIFAMTDRFDPTRNMWFPTGDMQIAPGNVPTIGGRYVDTATPLRDGRVLVAGGLGHISDFNQIHTFATSELYDPAAGAWTLTSDMHVGRAQQAAVSLLDGRVLVVGGQDPNFRPTATAEIFTPSARHSFAYMAQRAMWAPPARMRLPSTARQTYRAGAGFRKIGTWKVTGSLHVARSAVPMTLLPNGKVLIEGGDVFGSGGVTAELFNPATGKWTLTGSMHVARFYHCAMLLPNGRVLVVGGTNGPTAMSSAEIYNPQTGRWSMANRMNSTRYRMSALGLANGMVLVPGGITYDGIPRDSADLFNPATGTWTATPSMNSSRAFYIAAVLQNGKVLVADGVAQNNTNVQSAELYDPATNSWTVTGIPRGGAGNAVLLNDGTVLATDEGGQVSSELYDPTSGSWNFTKGSQTVGARTADTVTLLNDGRALLAGGCTGVSCPTLETEIYYPATQQWLVDAQMHQNRYVHAAVRLPDGRVLVAGGLDQFFHQISSAEIYTPAH